MNMTTPEHQINREGNTELDSDDDNTAPLSLPSDVRMMEHPDSFLKRLIALADTLDSIRDRLDFMDRRQSAGNSELIDAKKAAELCGIARSSFLSKNASGEIAPTPVRLGGRVLWRRTEILSWIESGCPSRPIWIARKEAKRNEKKTE